MVWFRFTFKEWQVAEKLVIQGSYVISPNDRKVNLAMNLRSH